MFSNATLQQNVYFFVYLQTKVHEGVSNTIAYLSRYQALTSRRSVKLVSSEAVGKPPGGAEEEAW